jgi:hypothetical protein
METAIAENSENANSQKLRRECWGIVYLTSSREDRARFGEAAGRRTESKLTNSEVNNSPSV